ncbi:hypothetical protein ES703_10444 [subsurface metagenome]
MNICLVGDPEDLSVVYVAWMARSKGIEVIELSEDLFGTNWSFSFEDLSLEEGKIKINNKNFQFSEFDGAYVRFNPSPSLPPSLKLSPEEQGAFIVERRGAIEYFLNIIPIVVANRPSSGRSNSSKPYQMHLLTKAGFDVPEWIITNEISTIMRFTSNMKDGVIYKSCSGLRSRVRKLDNKILQRMNNGTTPVVVQKYIEGHDVRVHVVKSKIFGTEIISNGIDYRFHSEPSEFRSISVPGKIRELCCKVTESEGLIIAGFDFRVTENDQWYCLEVNPVPTFLPYEIETGQQICNAMLQTFSRSIKNHN